MDTNGEVTEAPAPQITTAENEAGMLSLFLSLKPAAAAETDFKQAQQTPQSTK
jgi:hypothetical protein